MTTTSDFRAQCAELLAAIQLYTGLNPAASEMSSVEKTEKLMDAMAATRTALEAIPPPEPPTKEDLIQLAYEYFDFRGNSHGGFFFATSIEAKTDPYQSLTSFAHDVLERWGK